MAYDIVSPEQFLSEELFREDEFLENTRKYDWEQHRNKKVLVRGCGNIIAPPWAFMVITAKLTGVARSVIYGNEHDNVVVHRKAKDRQRT